MAAQCYWCQGKDQPERRDPLGTCSDCWVFVCDLHAELDTANLGKWKCFDGVAKLASAGAGFDDVDETAGLAITSTAELEQRFPRIARQTADERDQWHRQMDRVAHAAEETAPDRAHLLSEPDRRILLADAVGIVRHYLPREMAVMADVAEQPLPIGAGNLRRLLEAL